MITKESALKNISKSQWGKILTHFNTLYELEEISEHEENIVYFSWLMKQGYLLIDNSCNAIFDPKKVMFDENAYEITFEAEPCGGFNYDILCSYYEIEKITNVF